jgi:hypothetical protein
VSAAANSSHLEQQQWHIYQDSLLMQQVEDSGLSPIGCSSMAMVSL